MLGESSAITPDSPVYTSASPAGNTSKITSENSIHSFSLVTSKKKTQIREYRPQDRPSIFALISETLGEEKGKVIQKRWDWQFQQCPFDTQPPILVSESENQITGVIFAFPTPGVWNKQEIPMYTIAHFVVHPAHRGVGIALAKAMVELPYVMIGMPNSSSLAVWKHLGSSDFGQPLLYSKVLNLKAVNSKIPHLLLQFINPCWKVILNSSKWIQSRSKSPENLVYHEIVQNFPVQCDDLWNEILTKGIQPAAPGRGLSLMTQRNYRFLQWRFVECPDQDYHIHLAWQNEEKKHLLGYAVVRVGRVRNLIRGYIVDLMYRPNAERAAQILFEEVELYFKQKQVEVIHCLGPRKGTPWTQLLRKEGYWVRTPSSPMVCSPNFPGLPKSAVEEAFFRHVSFADGELDFVA